MNLKRTLTSIAAASLVLGTMAPVAFAGTTSYSFAQRHVTVDGHNLSNPWGFVSGGTNYFPIYYLQTAIGSLIPGATATWDGKNLMVNIAGFDATKLMGPTVPGTNGIYINGTLVQKFTRIVTNDKGTKIQTSFAPIYSLFGVLEQLGLKSGWSGDGTWSIAPALAKLTIAGNNNLSLGGSDTLSLAGTDSAGNATTVDASKVTWSVSNGGVISASGVFAATAAGTYAVTATYMGMTATANVVVAGTAVTYKVTSSAAGLLADGASYNTITVTAVDANGNADTTYNGKAIVADSSSPSLIAAATSASDQPSDFSVVGSTNYIQFTNGVATLAVGPTSAVNVSDTITVTDSATTSPLTSVTYSFTSAQSVLSKLALAVASGSSSAISANGQYSTTLTLSAENTAGNTFSGQPGTYVTLSLTGPGSFTSGVTPVTNETVYVPTSGTLPVTVYSMAGMPGTISVSATATGLTGATASIPTYINTAAGSISVTSTTGTDSMNNPYTLYTVQLLDSNGHPITTSSANDAFTVTDNSSTTSGALKYGSVSSTGVWSGVATSYTGNLVNGIATFAVETTTVGTGAVALTFNDTTNSFTQTANYSYVAGAATQVAVSPSTAVYNVKPGQTVSFSAQLEDANSNTVAQAGQAVTFSFATPLSGVQFPTGQTTYTVNTNASGVATVSFTIPSNSTGGSLQVHAVDGSLTAGNSATVTVLPATDTSKYATQLVITDGTNPLSSLSATSGSSIAGPVQVTAENAVGSAVASGDIFSISSSNTTVVSVVPATGDVSSVSGTFNIAGDLTVGTAGSSVITVKDISNPDMPSATFTVNVSPGAAAGAVVEYNGAIINSSNTVTLAAGQAVALQVVNADASGNPVPVVGNTAVTVNLTATGVTGDFRLSPTGAPVTSVTLQPGQTSVPVYFVAAAAETLNASTQLTGTEVAGTLASMSGLTYVASPLHTDATVAVAALATGKDANGNTVSAAGGTYTFVKTAGTGSGETINSTNGTITPGASAAAGDTFTVTYTVGSVTTTVTVTLG